jgi:hypothetical protein
MKKLLLSLLLLPQLIVIPSMYAQKIDIGIFTGANTNFLSFKSDYTIQEDIKSKPAISYNLGGFIKTKYDRINLLGSFEYMRIKNIIEPDFTMSDNTGQPLIITESRIINHNLLLSAIGTLRIKSGFYLGAGISGGYLVKSAFKLKDEFSNDSYDQDLKKRYNNNYYQRFVVSIPITMGYDFKRVSVFARFNKGFMNRIRGESYIKEIDNTLVLGFGYTLNKASVSSDQ